MTRKVIFSVLALAMVTLPAAAQHGGNLTSFSDRSGDRVLYISDQTLLHDYGGDIHQFWLNGTQPVDENATMEHSSEGSTWALFGSLTSFSDGDGQHNFYVGGTDNHIHQLYWSWSTSSGSDLDWTAMAGAPKVGTPMGYDNGPLTGFGNGRGQHVYYVSSGHVHHLYASGAGKPIEQDLTLIASATLTSTCASPNSMLTSFADGSTELVYYVGPTGHICELAWGQVYKFVYVCNFFGCRWTYQLVWQESSFDLTWMSTSTPAMVGSPLTGFADAYGQNVFYLGTNQHVYRLRLSRTGVWSNPDLTFTSGGSPATADSLTSFTQPDPIYGTDELVFYADNNHHLNVIKTYGNDVSSQSSDLSWSYVSGRWWLDTLAFPLNPMYCKFGTSLASISMDAAGTPELYYIGVDQAVYKKGLAGYPATDLTLWTGLGVAAGQGNCPIG